MDDGVTKFIAVSNFHPSHIEKAQSIATHKIVANQVQLHPLFQQKPMQKYCAEHNIHLVAYSPLGRGLIYTVPELKEIAEKHQASISQVTLAWDMAHNIIPIPKASSVGHLEDNFKACDLVLDEENIAKIDGIKRTKRTI